MSFYSTFKYMDEICIRFCDSSSDDKVLEPLCSPVDKPAASCCVDDNIICIMMLAQCFI